MEALITKVPSEGNVSTIVDSRNDIVFLVHEQDRHGRLVWNIRLAIGDLTPWRFGPFESKSAAVSVMNRLAALVDKAIGDLPAKIVFHAGCGFSQEF